MSLLETKKTWIAVNGAGPLQSAPSDAERSAPTPETLPFREPPGRKVQTVEVGVFLLMIIPPMASSFLISGQSGEGFVPAAIFSILSDLGLVSLVFYFIWRNSEPLKSIGWTLRTLPQEVGLGLMLFFPLMYGANLLKSALHAAGFSAPAKLPAALVASGQASIVLALVLVIVVAIAEETIFRGYLILRLNAATRSVRAAVLLSAAVFYLGHGYEGMAGVISVFFLGVVLALIYLWRRSLIAPMTIHFLIDFSGIVLAAFLKVGS